MSESELLKSKSMFAAETDTKVSEILWATAERLPQAGKELAVEAMNNPGSTLWEAGKTLAGSVFIGGVIGYIVPARGLTGLALGTTFTVPTVLDGYKKLSSALDESRQPGADLDGISLRLAKDTVSGTAQFAVAGFGGVIGAEGGRSLALSDSLVGTWGQKGQRLILKGENMTLRGADDLSRRFRPQSTSSSVLDLDNAGWLGRQKMLSDIRIAQFRSPKADEQLYFGSLHGHSRYSDGMGLPKDIYAQAKKEGIHFTAITDHNHRAARDGVHPSDPRYKDQKGTPTIAEDPKLYAQTFADARAATESDKFVALAGIELGTIGKTGKEGGVNHINILEVLTLFESIRQPRTLTETLLNPLWNSLGIKAKPRVSKPDVVAINDGDYRSLVNHLDLLKDSSGKRPIIQLNHPRYAADENLDLPAALRGRDYGQKSFKSQREWQARFGKYASQIELITGEALARKPGDVIKQHDINADSYAGYIDKGLKLSPTFGRDFHYGDPGGSPAGTGVLLSKLDRNPLLDALRERRTMVTTNIANLKGHMVVNDSHPMGSILDQRAVPDLHIKLKLSGEIDPTATYTAKLWGDPKIGDKILAGVLQTVELRGKQLLSQNSEFSFAQVSHKLGNRGAYYVEVERSLPRSKHTDHMWTAPVFVEPLAGHNHSILSRSIYGLGAGLIIGN